MSMSSDQIAVLRRSWKELEPDLPRFIDTLYEEFFGLEPQLRLLFEVSMDEQHLKLAGFIGRVVEDIERPAEINLWLRALGERHADYGVRVHHFDSLGLAWMNSLHRILGDRLTREARIAWKAFYDLLAEGMQEGMGLPAQPAPLD